MTNSRTTKKALLSSALALLMCVAMLIATTFAWFTDTASTAVNKIQSGTLKVELRNADNTAKLDADEALTWVKASGHENDEVLWEPGCTYNLKSFRIKNNGNLALKYQVQISGIIGDENSAKLLEVIDFSAKVGNTDVAVLDSWEGNLEPGGVTDVITISGTMQSTAGNEYQNESIDGIYITVVATQDTVEYDSKNNQYDEDATYPEVVVDSVAAVNEAIKEGSSILLVNSEISVDMNTVGVTKAMNDTGCVALYFNKENTPNMADAITVDGNGTVKLLGTGMAVWAHHGANIVINGGTYDNSAMNSGWQLIYANNDSKITVNGGIFIANVNGELFNTSNQPDGSGGTIIIKGGLYNKPLIPNSGGVVNGWQAADNYNDETGDGIKIADGYKQVEEQKDGQTWYRVVKDTATN